MVKDGQLGLVFQFIYLNHLMRLARLFFHQFPLNLRQAKLKKFSKLKVFSLKIKIFLLHSREFLKFPREYHMIFS